MSMLIPESGLIFWMLLSFGIVVFVVAKFGFPVIIKMVEDRKNFIEDSLFQAQKARDEVEKLHTDRDKIIKQARKEHAEIIQEANVIKDKILEDAHSKAMEETKAMLDNARVQIQVQKNEAMQDVRKEIADLALSMTEKVLRKNLEKKKEQKELIQKLLDEVQNSQN